MTSLQFVDPQKLHKEEGIWVDTWMPVVWGNSIKCIGGPGWTRTGKQSAMVKGDRVEEGSAGRNDVWNRVVFDG